MENDPDVELVELMVFDWTSLRRANTLSSVLKYSSIATTKLSNACFCAGVLLTLVEVVDGKDDAGWHPGVSCVSRVSCFCAASKSITVSVLRCCVASFNRLSSE